MSLPPDPPGRGVWPAGTPRTTGVIPVLSRSAHDRDHLGRSLPDPTRGRPVRVLTVDERRAVPVAEGEGGPALVWDEQPELPLGAVYLGEAGGVPYAAVRGERASTVNGRPVDTWAGLRELGADLGDLDAGLLAEAIGILEWHERARFSPLSGAATTIERAGWVQRDPVTGAELFPRTDPAVIMLVHDGGDRCVLGRQAVWPPGRFSVLAGFVEAGDAAAAAGVSRRWTTTSRASPAPCSSAPGTSSTPRGGIVSYPARAARSRAVSQSTGRYSPGPPGPTRSRTSRASARTSSQSV